LIHLNELDGSNNVSNELFEKYRTFSYSFSGKNRILGYCGSLGRNGNGLLVDDFMLCCSGICSIESADHHISLIRNNSEQSGWTILKDNQQLQFQQNDLLLDVVTGCSNPPINSYIHIILSYGKGEEDRYARFFRKVSILISRIQSNDARSRNHHSNDTIQREFKVLRSREELIAILSDSHNAVYTGAGILVAKTRIPPP
jgi:hypothetical protein